MSIYIFGAHSRARTLKEYLNVIYPDLRIRAFLVDNDEENPESVDRIPVVKIGMGEVTQGYDFGPKDRVYIGTRGVSHPPITKLLSSVGFEDIIPVSAKLGRNLDTLLDTLFQAELRALFPCFFLETLGTVVQQFQHFSAHGFPHLLAQSLMRAQHVIRYLYYKLGQLFVEQ